MTTFNSREPLLLHRPNELADAVWNPLVVAYAPADEDDDAVDDVVDDEDEDDVDIEELDDTEAEEDDVVVTLTREEKLAEPAEARVVPIQTTEFTCKRCFLVKHRSQLKDKKKGLCRDCA